MNAPKFAHTLPLPNKTIFIQRHYVELGGDLAVGSLLSQIVFWTQPNKKGQSKSSPKRDGHYWVAKTREQWMAETGLTLKQYKRAITVLKTKGFIITRIMKFGGIPMTHVRCLLNQGVPLLTNSNHNSKSLSPSYNGSCGTGTKGTTELDPKGPSGWSLSAHAYSTETTTKNTTEVLAQKNIQNNKEEKIEENKGEIEGIQEVEENKEEGSMKVSEIVSSMKEKRKEGSTNLNVLWKKRMELFVSGYQQELTLKEKGQLKLLKKSVGDKASDVIDYALNHWMQFASKAGAECGTLWPASPTIGFLLKYHGIAVRMMDKEAELLTQQDQIVAGGLLQPIAENVTIPVANPPLTASADEPYHLSAEELAKLIEGLKE